ncbi:hypothetical protein ACOMHN_025979 [Nucella lapillus]
MSGPYEDSWRYCGGGGGVVSGAYWPRQPDNKLPCLARHPAGRSVLLRRMLGGQGGVECWRGGDQRHVLAVKVLINILRRLTLKSWQFLERRLG